MQTQPSTNDWDRGMRLISYCPVCESTYEAVQTQLLWQEGETRAFHLLCKKCNHATLTIATSTEVGASAVGIMTDLSYEDVVRFRLNHPVCVNDVIDAHLLFSNGNDSWVSSPFAHKQPKTSIKRVRKSVY